MPPQGLRWTLVLLIAGAVASVSQTAKPRLLALPNSVILFGTYNELWVTSPAGVEKIVPPIKVGYNGGYFIDPSISPNGEFVAWGFAHEWEGGRLQNRARFTLGVYSRLEKQWRTYGDMDEVGNPVFSPNGWQVAFIAQQENHRELMILNLRNGALEGIPDIDVIAKNVGAIRSWSPDGKKLAVEIHRGGKQIVAILEIATRQTRYLADGFNPTWSPTGDWISYFDPEGAKCLLIRPDGPGARIIRELRQSRFSYRRFGWGAPVWSPDGKEILVDEMKGDGDFGDTVLIDVQRGRVLKRINNSLPVFGWVRPSASNQRNVPGAP